MFYWLLTGKHELGHLESFVLKYPNETKMYIKKYNFVDIRTTKSLQGKFFCVPVKKAFN